VIFGQSIGAAGVTEVERRTPADRMAQIELCARTLVLESQAGRLVCHASVHCLARVVPALILGVDGMGECLLSADVAILVPQVKRVAIFGGVAFVHFVVTVERDVVAVHIGRVVSVQGVCGASHQNDLVVFRGAGRVVRPDFGGRVFGSEVCSGSAARHLQVEGYVELLLASVGGRAKHQMLFRRFNILRLVGGLFGARAAAFHVQFGRFRVVVIIVFLDLFFVGRVFFMTVVVVVIFREFSVSVVIVVVMVVFGA